MNDNISALLLALSIPSAFTGLCFWLAEKKIERREKLRDKKEAAREENEFLLIKCVGASLALGEATAHAIRDGKCNGEMSAALEYAKTVKHEQKDFMTKQSITNFY